MKLKSRKMHRTKLRHSKCERSTVREKSETRADSAPPSRRVDRPRPRRTCAQSPRIAAARERADRRARGSASRPGEGDGRVDESARGVLIDEVGEKHYLPHYSFLEKHGVKISRLLKKKFCAFWMRMIAHNDWPASWFLTSAHLIDEFVRHEIETGQLVTQRLSLCGAERR